MQVLPDSISYRNELRIVYPENDNPGMLMLGLGFKRVRWISEGEASCF